MSLRGSLDRYRKEMSQSLDRGSAGKICSGGRQGVRRASEDGKCEIAMRWVRQNSGDTGTLQVRGKWQIPEAV